MTLPEFRAVALALYGHEWQSPLARALGVTPRTVRRWASGESPLPGWLEEKLTGLAGARDTGPLIRDEWIIGEGRDGRRYIVHQAAPRFTARIVPVGEGGEIEPDEAAADLLSGIAYSNDDVVLAEFQWRDAPLPGHALVTLMEAASDFIDAFDGGEI